MNVVTSGDRAEDDEYKGKRTSFLEKEFWPKGFLDQHDSNIPFPEIKLGVRVNTRTEPAQVGVPASQHAGGKPTAPSPTCPNAISLPT